MRDLGRAALALSLLALLAGAAADAQKPDPSELEKTRAEIRELRRNLDKIRNAAHTAQERLAETQLQLDITMRELGLAEAVQRQLKNDADATELETREFATRLQLEKKQVADRLRELYKLGGLSYVRVMVSIDRERNPFEAISMLSFLVNRDARQIQRFRTHQQELALKLDELARQRARATLALAEVSRRQRAFQQARADQQILVSTLHLQDEQSAERLAGLEEKARRLERLFALLYEQAHQRQSSGIGANRGALPWPLRGAIVQDFGKQRSEKFATYTVNNGLRIAAEPGTEAHAVFAGTVLYSQWFKGYGNLVIVDHGDRVFSLYGNTRIGLVHVGDKVTAGQPIATVNQGEADEGGYLYFEIRENNRPVNPRLWLKP